MKKIPIPYITTLEDVYEDFNNDLSSFVTFRVQSGTNSIISNVTIPFCRFRKMDNGDLFEIRSCDCNGSICGHPTQKIYMTENHFKDYVFLEQINLHYFFVCNVLTIENTNNSGLPGVPD